jgi:hypothetical protein
MVWFTVGRIPVIILIIGLSILSVLMTSSGVRADKPLMRLFFVVPFSIETYVPITIQNIEEQGHTIWFMEEQPFISELLNMLKSRPTKRQILTKGVRLKADFGESGSVFFIDRNGSILQQNTGATFNLSAEQLEQLQRQLHYFIGVVDVKAFKRSEKPNK